MSECPHKETNFKCMCVCVDVCLCGEWSNIVAICSVKNKPRSCESH